MTTHVLHRTAQNDISQAHPSPSAIVCYSWPTTLSRSAHGGGTGAPQASSPSHPSLPRLLPGKSPRCKREAYDEGAISTWPIEGVAESIVVVAVEESQADVSRAVQHLPEYQG